MYKSSTWSQAVWLDSRGGLHKLVMVGMSEMFPNFSIATAADNLTLLIAPFCPTFPATQSLKESVLVAHV